MVRTRFAPSPTGFLHIGGVRTALFNWLFSRRHLGRFILRIDDTDQQRNVEATLQPILDGFRWLGIDWDEGPEGGGDYGPYFQSQRREIYSRAVEDLLRSGHAYRDFATTEELEAERQEAEAEKRRFIYSRRWMAETPEQVERFEAEGRTSVVRLRMPRQGTCRFVDLVRGEVEFEWAREQDHVIQRADGSCLYHLASAVDDHFMEISHVIRAEEHLSNTPRHLFITESLGWEPPRYAHLPFVAEPGSKNKLSKRKLEKYLKNPDFAKLYEHGLAIARAIDLEIQPESFNPVIVDFYEKIGYLPDALVNYLLLLGWALDDKTERFTRQEMIDLFSLERVNRSPASFDPLKLWAFEEAHMQEVAVEVKRRMVVPYLEMAGLLPASSIDDIDAYVGAIVEAAGDRIKVAGDILEFDDFFIADNELAYDEKAFEKRLRKPPEATALLADFRQQLAAADSFEVDSLEKLLRDFVDARGVKIGQVIHALRVAVTGKAVGFGMFEILEILGRDRSLTRIDRALDLASHA
jgi:glutamyl-tRNA synthetase